MSLKANASALSQGFKDLSIAWQQTRGSWRDAKALEFEEKYLSELPDLSTKVGLVLGELEILMRKAKSDCE